MVISKVTKNHIQPIQDFFKKNKIEFNLDEFKKKLKSKDYECIVVSDALTNDFCGFILFNKKEKVCCAFYGVDDLNRKYLVNYLSKQLIYKYIIPETDMDHLNFFKNNFTLQSKLNKKYFGSIDGVSFFK